MLKNLLIGVVGLSILLLVVSFFLPRHVHLERSTVIEAPQATVFALVNGFTRFNEWSPWAGIDPATSYVYDGPSHGVGASMSWQSDDPDVGSGGQTITASTAHSRVESDLDFGPQGTAKAFFDLAPEGDGVKVTWGFDSDMGMNPIGRWFGLMLPRWLGPSYDQGLAQLKTLAESLPDTDFASLNVKHTTLEARPIAYVSQRTTTDYDAIGAAFAESFRTIGAYLQENGLEAAGPPLSITHEWSAENYTFAPAIPIVAAPAANPDTEGAEGAEGAEASVVKIGETPAGKALKIVHTGPYTGLEAAYGQAEAYIEAHGLEVAGPHWETWISDPATTPESELVTEIYYPLK